MFVNKHMFIDRGRMGRMNMWYDMGELISVYKLLRRMNNRLHILWRKRRHTFKSPFLIV